MLKRQHKMKEEEMATNVSTNLNREQKIVLALCKHLSLDPKIFLGDAVENYELVLKHAIWGPFR
jgi:hypothetical protein